MLFCLVDNSAQNDNLLILLKASINDALDDFSIHCLAIKLSLSSYYKVRPLQLLFEICDFENEINASF
jgi:hypothetical protein